VGLVIDATDSHRLALAVLGVQSAIGAVILFMWKSRSRTQTAHADGIKAETLRFRHERAQ
jgi:hypothetical protein